MDNCDSPKYLIPKITIQGEKGDKGDQGTQGADGSFAALTSLITHDGNESTGIALDIIIDALLYIALSIDSYSIATPQVEIGSTIASINFNWTYNKGVISQQIDGPGVATGPLDVALRQHTASGLSITTNSTYTLTSNDGTNQEQASAFLQFLHKIYWGARPSATIDSALVLSLSGNELKTTRSKSFTVTAGTSDYIYYAYPVSFGMATFTVGGFSGGFEPPVILSFMNASGFVEDFYVYRSTNLNLGQVTVDVT